VTRRRRPVRDQIRRALWIAAMPLTYPAQYKDRETWEREGNRAHAEREQSTLEAPRG
jgi:hypothetical protein